MIEWVTATVVLGAALVVLVDMVRAARVAITPGWDAEEASDETDGE